MILRKSWLMRRSLPALLPLLGTLSLACGGSGSTANTGGGSGTGSETATSSGTGTETASSASSGTGAGGMMMAGAIPDPGPGNQVDQDFTEMEPNDTPETATPLGTAMMGSVNVWVTSNQLGGAADAADYFVFKSGPAAGTMTLNICFSAPITDMTATLWKVVNAKAELPPIGTWTSVATCIQGPPMGAPLEADSTYLFELTAKGGVATYNA